MKLKIITKIKLMAQLSKNIARDVSTFLPETSTVATYVWGYKKIYPFLKIDIYINAFNS